MLCALFKKSGFFHSFMIEIHMFAYMAHSSFLFIVDWYSLYTFTTIRLFIHMSVDIRLFLFFRSYK